MKSRIRQTIFTIILTLILVSCTSAPTPIPTAEFTKTIEPTLTPTIIPTETVSPINTPEVKTNVMEKSTSPDSAWTAIVSDTTFTEPQGEEVKLTIISSDGKRRLDVDSVHFDHYVDLMDLPQKDHIYLRVFQWSNNSKNLYFSKAYPYGTPCSLSWLGTGGADLRQFDLMTGKTKILSNELAIEMELSPNEQQLIYTNQINGNIFLRDLITGYKNVFQVPESQHDSFFETSTTGLHWSPDGKYVVYAMLVGVCDSPIALYSDVLLIDIQKMTQTVLINDAKGGWLPIEWRSQDKIKLQDNDDNFWSLNPVTKEITPVQ